MVNFRINKKKKKKAGKKHKKSIISIKKKSNIPNIYIHIYIFM